MKRQAFADLIGVSKQMVSKYASSGLIAEDGGDVDAAASLELLEGRLDEDKRAKALAALAAIEGSRPAPTTSRGEAVAPVRQSAKVQKDEVELQLKRLQYGREAGELVSADDIDAAARQAVASLREAFGNRRRDMAERICLDFGIPAEKASALGRLIGRQFEETIGVFGEEMAALAAVGDKPAPAATPEPAQATA